MSAHVAIEYLSLDQYELDARGIYVPKISRECGVMMLCWSTQSRICFKFRIII